MVYEEAARRVGAHHGCALPGTILLPEQQISAASAELVVSNTSGSEHPSAPSLCCWFCIHSKPAEGFGDVPHADNPAGSIGSDNENFQDFYSGDPGSFDGDDKPWRRKAPHHHVCDVEKTMEQRILDGDLIVPVDIWHHLPTYGSTIMSTKYFVQYRSVFATVPSEKLLK